MVEATGDVQMLQVRNHHLVEAGPPPTTNDADLNQYTGYFENVCGEQAVFMFERTASTSGHYLGHASWENSDVVIDGVAPDLVLDEAELSWLCVLPAGHRQASISAPFEPD